MKKIIALILLLSVVTLPVLASAVTDIKGNVNEKAIETLVDYGVVDGYPDGTFHPEKNITRAEVAKLLVCAIDPDVAPAVKPTFTDVENHWAFKYIEAAAAKKIINGYGNGLFKPEANITFEQLCTMVLNVLGYDVPKLEGNWPDNAVVQALKLGLTENVTSRGQEIVTRGEVAQMIYNALDCNLVEVYEGTAFPKAQILRDIFGYQYTIAMDISTVETFGNYVKHYERESKPDEIVSISRMAFVSRAPFTGKVQFIIPGEAPIELAENTVIWYNGGKVEASKLTSAETVKLIYVDDALTDVVMWEETDRAIVATLEAKYPSGDEFVAGQSVVTFYGYNYAIVCNKTAKMIIYNAKEVDEGLELLFINGEKFTIPAYDKTNKAELANLSWNALRPVVLKYATDGAIFDIGFELTQEELIAAFFNRRYVENAAAEIDGKEYDIAVSLEEYLGKLYPAMDKIDVVADEEVANDYAITFYKSIYSAQATVSLIVHD